MTILKTNLIAYLSLVSESDPPLKAVNQRVEYGPAVDYLEALGFITVDDTTDDMAITTTGRLFAGMRPEGVPELSVEVAEITGNIAEAELAARYMEGKMAAIDMAISRHREPIYDRSMTWDEAYQHMAIVLRESANEFRMGLHLPAVHIDGRVIPYNEDRSTGVAHQTALHLFFTDVYSRNVMAGWWTDIETGLPKKRNLGELMILIVTELAEAYKAWLHNEQDDKLPQYPGLGVELGDTMIRIADLCGALAAGNIVGPRPDVFNPGDTMFFQVVEIAEAYEKIRKTPEAKGDEEIADFIPPMDVAPMIDAKLDFNAHRPDHKIENRLKEDGKRT